jgi:phosphopantothenoylcysteine decarboxylase/phosphopantothenate--cysteine ligase
VANDVTVPGAGFGTDTNRVTVLTRAGVRKDLDGTKRAVAQGILEMLLSLAPTLGGQKATGA